jgi:hypothetical protein
MSTNVTPILHLNLPPFDSAPWDEDVNDNFAILDGAMGQVFGVADFNGLWKNSTMYPAGVTVVDGTDSTLWVCNLSHASLAYPATFADERAYNGLWWTQTGASAQDAAQMASESAAQASAANANAQLAAAQAGTSAQAAAGSASAAEAQTSISVLLTGSTMTGLLILSGDPTVALGAATKEYVDARVGGVGFVKTSGDTMTGPLIMVEPTIPQHGATKNYVDNMPFLHTWGGTISGPLTVLGNLGIGPNGTNTYSDGNYFILNFSSDGWRFLYERASGTLHYQNWQGTDLFYINSGGDIIARSVVYGVGVYSYGNVDGNWLHSRGDCQIDGNFNCNNAVQGNWLHSRGDLVGDGNGSVGGNWNVSGGVYTNYMHSNGNIDAAGTHTGGAVDVGYVHSSGDIRAGGSLYAGGGATVGGTVTAGDVHAGHGGFDNGLDTGGRFSCPFIVTTITSADGWQFWHADGGGVFIRMDGYYDYGPVPYWSDRETKDNIAPADVDCLEAVNRIELVKFDWKDGSGSVPLGFVAQQVAEAFDGVVIHEPKNRPPSDEPWRDRVDYGAMLALLTGAIQQLTKEVRHA